MDSTGGLAVLIRFIDDGGATIGTGTVCHEPGPRDDAEDAAVALGRIAADAHRACYGKLAATVRIVLDVAI